MWDYLHSYYYQLVSIVFLISVDFGGKGSYRGLLVIEFPGWATISQNQNQLFH